MATLQNVIGGKSTSTSGDGTHEVRNAATGEVTISVSGMSLGMQSPVVWRPHQDLRDMTA
mgnify:CR=1 FL=1